MIGKNLVKIMKKRDVNQVGLCKMTGFKAAHMSKIVNNKGGVSFDKAIAIANALNCTLDELAGR